MDRFEDMPDIEDLVSEAELAGEGCMYHCAGYVHGGKVLRLMSMHKKLTCQFVWISGILGTVSLKVRNGQHLCPAHQPELAGFNNTLKAVVAV